MWSHLFCLGEVVIVCFGGIVVWNDFINFMFYAFGVKRYVFVVLGANFDKNVILNYLFNRIIRVWLDDLFYDQIIGFIWVLVFVYWDFGLDGAFYCLWYQNM